MASSNGGPRKEEVDAQPPPVGKAHLPYPKGPYGVSMVDTMSYGIGSEGQLVRLMFPCKRKDFWSVEPSWPTWLPADKYVEGFAAYVNLWPSVLRVVMWLTAGTQHLPLFTEEPIVEEDKEHKFPVVVFSHGLGQCRSSYSVLCYELASHGFIVAALEHRDGSSCITPEAVESEVKYTSQFMNGDEALWSNPKLQWMPYTKVSPQLKEQPLRTSQLKKRAEEVLQCVQFLEQLNAGVLKRGNYYVPRTESKQWEVLQSLAGKLDFDRMMLSGHSMGGATTMKALSRENKFKCGIALDPWMYAVKTEADEMFPKIGNQPLLCITMEAFQNVPNQKCLGKLLELAPSDSQREIFTIKGSVHESQADAPFMSSGSLTSRIVSRYLIGPPSPTDHILVMDVNIALMLRFASKYLKLPEFEAAEEMLKEHENLLKTGLIMDITEK